MTTRPPGESGPFHRSGAEGATAPETLRRTDRTVGDALERSRGAVSPAHRRSNRGGAARKVKHFSGRATDAGNLSGPRTEGARSRFGFEPSRRRSLVVRDPMHVRLHLRRPPRDAARRASSRARRAHGAVRRLFDAGPVPDRHHRRAQPGAERGRPVRRLAHGAGAACRSRPRDHRTGARGADAGRLRRSRPRARALHAAPHRGRRDHRRPDGDAAVRAGR